jgi:PPK2 family polyphosphate:nucleotide phosphotransferase
MNNYLVKPNEKISLDKIDPNDCGQWEGKKDDAKLHLIELTAKLDQLQEILYAEHKHKILIILQGIDGSGKDGTIRAIFDGVNPQGVQVGNFKVPSAEELDHDFLWRIHAQAPSKGKLVIFNRSQYEDVLVVRVHNLISSEECQKRYSQISEFEKMLAEEGTSILKFYLHISPDVQKTRLLERLDDPTKQWKFNPNDINERKLWGKYMQAYEDMLNHTSHEYAPWYIIPSNNNWYRSITIAQIIVDELTKLNMQYPALQGEIKTYKKEILTW